MSDDDGLDALDRLRLLDPLAVNGEQPPVKGSTRYQSILERAMHPTRTDAEAPTPTVPAPTPPGPTTDPGHRPLDGTPPARRGRHGRRRRRATLSVVAAAFAITVGATVLRPDSGVSPAAALARAADATADVTSLRGTLTEVDPASESTGSFEVARDDLRFERRGTYADGHLEGSTTVMIGDEVTQVALDGSVERSTIDEDDERLEPFHTSSAAVVAAVVEHGEPADLGTEPIDGTDATHYRIEPDDAVRRSLAALDAGVLGWFQLDDVEQLTSLDIWVADDLIRRVQVVSFSTSETTNTPGERTVTMAFHDFNADIEIEPLAVDPSAPVVGEH